MTSGLTRSHCIGSPKNCLVVDIRLQVSRMEVVIL